MKEVWAVYNPRNKCFDRIVFRGWWFYRQQCYMNVETNAVSWKDVPFFGEVRRKK